jgi:hypothetical protein
MERVRIEGDKRLFEVDEDLSLELLGVSNFKLAQWERAYEKRNPPPEVPLMEIKIANKPIAKFDYNDPGYRRLKSTYDGYKNLSQFQFVASEGVATEVPDNFKAHPDLIVDGSEAERKMLWLYNVLRDDDSIAELTQAVLSISNATPEAIEDAEKNSEPLMSS